MTTSDPIAELYQQACKACPELGCRVGLLHWDDDNGWSIAKGPVEFFLGSRDAHDLIAGRCLRVLEGRGVSIARILDDCHSVMLSGGEYQELGFTRVEALLRAVIAAKGGGN